MTLIKILNPLLSTSSTQESVLTSFKNADWGVKHQLEQAE